jgi:S1-C subfamily serine protease
LIISASVSAQNAAKVFERAKSAVVTISTSTGTGTGFIISDGKLLVTCFHVVEGEKPQNLKIDLKGVRIAAIVAWDRNADIAIFKIEGKVPKSLTLHSDGLMKPGTKIYVIGNPLGFLNQTISEGIVSGIRTTPGAKLLQISAPVSPGSSGSPVINPTGQVVGMVKGSIEEGQSLNFAVSSSDLRRVKSDADRALKDNRVGRLARTIYATAIYTGPTKTSGVLYRMPADKALIVLLPTNNGWLRVVMENYSFGFIESRNIAFQPGATAGKVANSAGAPAKSTSRWPKGNARLADLGSKLGSKELGDESARKMVREGSKAVPFLITAACYIYRDHREARERAERALVAIGSPSVDPLIQLLLSKNEQIRWQAASMLGDLKDRRAVDPLIRALEDTNGTVRFIAILSLRQLNDARAVMPLIKLLSDDEWGVRSSAARLLGDFKDPRAVEPLIKLLSDSDRSVRGATIEALGDLKDKRALEPLRELLKTEFITDLRDAATKAIKEILGQSS